MFKPWRSNVNSLKVDDKFSTALEAFIWDPKFLRRTELDILRVQLRLYFDVEESAHYHGDDNCLPKRDRKTM